MSEYNTPSLVPADPSANVADLLANRVVSTPEAILFRLPTADGSWQAVTAAEFGKRVTALAKGFIAAGISPGDKIGLMCRTRFEWTLIDFAVWYAGAVLVPIYETSSPAQVSFNLKDSDAVAIIVETADHFSRFDEIHPNVPAIRNVWQIEIGDLDKLVTLGKDIPDSEVEQRRRIAIGDDIATVIYTSGSTGTPKGCALTHSNFVELSRNAAHALAPVLENKASTLLFITLAHVFARFISVLCVHAAVTVGHQPDTKQLLPSMVSFRPTFLLAVPRVFEKVYNVSEQKAETGGRGKIFRAAAETAVAYSKAQVAGYIPFKLRIKFALFNKLVYEKLRKAMGGQVRYAVSGSAPLGPRLGHFYHALGITILEGYGLTETTAPATVNLPSLSKIGTVGPALPGVSLRLAEDGEVEVKGINVFQGYWNNPEATNESLNEGWFRTGDIGTIDNDGFLTITGRKKELIVTAGGKNVSPAALEDPIRANPLVGQVIVVGDKRPYIAALITLDPEMLPTWLENNNQDPHMSIAEASNNEAVHKEVQRAIDIANAKVSRAESVRRFVILPTELTEASGHLTPKLSIKRNVILSDFSEEIDNLYSKYPVTTGQSIVM